MNELFEDNRNYTLDDPELAILGNKAKLAQWRHRGVGPSYFKLGRKIVYQGSELNNWAAKRYVQTREVFAK